MLRIGGRSAMTYAHTQRAPLGLLFGAASLGLLVLGIGQDDEVAAAVLLAVAVVFAAVTALFSQLTVSEQGDHLRVRFGPLRLCGTTVPYDSIRAVRRARSRLIDGWGVHWIPGRGWTFNLWGFDCVELQTDRGVVRIGTDDPEGLAQHLCQRTSLPAA
jgi:hypothetical protein